MRRTITRVAVLATTLTATFAVAAVPASATVDLPPIPWSVDNVVITEPQVDFGDGNVLNVWGDPLPGHVIWLVDPDDDSWWPVLDGRIFINNAAGLCARMQIAYYDSGTLIATRSGGTVCSPDNRLHAWNVSLMPYGSDDIDYIYIRLQTVGANGVATTQDSFGPLYP